MNLGAFAFVVAAARRTGTASIEGWAGMNKYAPRLATFGAIFFFSLAGIPPLAGWYAKFAMFVSIIRPVSTWTTVLAVIAAVNAVIALVYYAKVVKSMWMDPVPADASHDTEAVQPIAGSLVLAMVIAVVFVVIAGILPDVAATFAEAAEVVTAGR